MAVLRIRTFGDPVLRQRASEVGEVTDLHRRLVADMYDTMRDAPGVGLAGPQVGVLERIFVWEHEDEHGALFNPVLTVHEGATEAEEEGCLSLPGLLYPVERAVGVTVEGLDAEGEPVKIDAVGYRARIFQHEIDHLDGVLFIDRLPQEMKREALSELRAQALGLAPPPKPAPAEETL